MKRVLMKRATLTTLTLFSAMSLATMLATSAYAQANGGGGEDCWICDNGGFNGSGDGPNNGGSNSNDTCTYEILNYHIDVDYSCNDGDTKPDATIAMLFDNKGTDNLTAQSDGKYNGGTSGAVTVKPGEHVPQLFIVENHSAVPVNCTTSTSITEDLKKQGETAQVPDGTKCSYSGTFYYPDPINAY